MKVFECEESNDNTYFLLNILRELQIDKSKYKWGVSDLDLVPVFHGDYNGTGGAVSESISYGFLQKIEREKVAVIDDDERSVILNDTQTIRNGVFICLDKAYKVDIHTYHPKVERDDIEKLYDDRAKHEIRILDGDLFFVL